MLEIKRWPFVVEPLLQGAVEALELAERLRMRGRGVDQLDACLGKLALERNLDDVEAAGEDQAVIGEQLARQPVGGAGGDEAGPGRLAGRACDRDRGEQEARVVVDDIDDPDRVALGEQDLGGIDLPEVVRELALEPLVRLAPPRRLRSHQVVALERPMDRRHRRRLPPRTRKLGMDATRAPAWMPLTHRHDLHLEQGVDLPRRAARPPRTRLQTIDALIEIAPPIAVIARSRDPVPTTDL